MFVKYVLSPVVELSSSVSKNVEKKAGAILDWVRKYSKAYSTINTNLSIDF